MSPAFKPMGTTARRAADGIKEKAERVIRITHPGAVVYRVIVDEALFPVVLFSVAAVDGVAEAAKAVFFTPLDAKEPAFRVDSGWDLVEDQ